MADVGRGPLGLDTAIFIYFIEEHPEFLRLIAPVFAALEYAFTELGRDHVISLIRPANVGSIRVAERIGETLEGHTGLFGADALVYGIPRANFRT